MGYGAGILMRLHVAHRGADVMNRRLILESFSFKQDRDKLFLIGRAYPFLVRAVAANNVQTHRARDCPAPSGARAAQRCSEGDRDHGRAGLGVSSRA